jgi:hypothetical protein
MLFDPSPIAKRLRSLHRAGRLTHAEYAVGDTLLWSCRAPGRDDSQIGYKQIAKLAHVAYSTAVAAVAKLIALRVLTKRKTRLRVVWSLGIASRQWRNIYRLVAVQPAPRTESDQRPAVSVKVSKPASMALEMALSRLGSVLGGRAT